MRPIARILVDESHRQAWSTRPEVAARMSPANPADASFAQAALTLVEAGFEVSAHVDGPITSDLLDGIDVLVLPHCSDDAWEATVGHGSPVYAAAEIEAIDAFVRRGGGLVILAVHDTATRPLAELMTALRELTVRARAGRMKSSELADSTLTVTSLGDRGVEAVYGVIYPPQVAIVGFGRIADRPWAVNGGLCVRPVVTATLAADHRVSDGHRGGLFLDAVDRLLQEPEKL